MTLNRNLVLEFWEMWCQAFVAINPRSHLINNILPKFNNLLYLLNQCFLCKNVAMLFLLPSKNILKMFDSIFFPNRNFPSEFSTNL